NLGNAYFKSKKLGQAILNYQRAHRLNPRDADVRANLSYVNRLLEYKIDDKRNWFWRKKTELLSYVTLHECWLLALITYFAFVSGLLIALLRRQGPVFGRMGALGLCLALFCSFPLLLKVGEWGMARRGVVTEAQAEVRYAPSSSDRIAFRLVEGLQVSINDEKQEWYRIELTDGRSGWVPQSQVTAI
ncbi:MAG: tetratricopeptide repeat protein, partial [Candidatus Omnitrophica bacterium]|nr:tetratricopeptide repeat protein [Candidatus Omnitrophota bacterium]